MAASAEKVEAPAFRPLLVTLGDPDGLGPELAVRHFLQEDARRGLKVLMIGPEAALCHHARSLGAQPFWTRIDDPERLIIDKGEGLFLYQPPGLDDYVPTPGEPGIGGGRAAGLSLDVACGLLVRQPDQGVCPVAGRFPGLVTLPLNKGALQAAGFPFPGHTEFLAAAARLAPRDVVMHLCGDVLRVSLVTTHPALKDVPGEVTMHRVLRTIRLTSRFLRDLGVEGTIAVCGLNPHAGEGGAIGREEIDVVGPGVALGQYDDIDVVGPLPADTVFYRAARGDFAAVVAMYHDQGLAPLKLLHFGEAVNVTLGLPFVRTSVDHGTGYDLVGTGRANLSSFRRALALAAKLGQ